MSLPWGRPASRRAVRPSIRPRSAESFIHEASTWVVRDDVTASMGATSESAAPTSHGGGAGRAPADAARGRGQPRHARLHRAPLRRRLRRRDGARRRRGPGTPPCAPPVHRARGRDDAAHGRAGPRPRDPLGPEPARPAGGAAVGAGRCRGQHDRPARGRRRLRRQAVPAAGAAGAPGCQPGAGTLALARRRVAPSHPRRHPGALRGRRPHGPRRPGQRRLHAHLRLVPRRRSPHPSLPVVDPGVGLTRRARPAPATHGAAPVRAARRG